MGEHMPAEILVGGRVPTALVPELCAAITAAGASLDWGDACFKPSTAQDLLDNCTEHDKAVVLQLCDDQASWGEFKELEAFLVERAIAFDRFSDGRYEFDPEWVSLRPGSELQVQPINSQREPQVYLKSVWDLRKRLTLARTAAERGQHKAVLRHLRDLQAAVERVAPPLPSPLESLTIE